MASREPTVAVIGGGVAGLTAACVLAQTGFRVTLFERRPYLGGRASSYVHPATGEVVDNCQHVLFGSCTNLIAFYRTIGIEDKIRWYERITFLEPGGRRSVLAASRLPAPLDMLPAFLRVPFLQVRDKLAIAQALPALLMRSYPDDGITFDQWLVRHRQTPKAIKRFWKPILVSALSEDLNRIAVRYAAQVVRESMKSRKARSMGIPTAPLSELYRAAQDCMVAQGGAVRFREGVESFKPNQAGVRLRVQDREEEFEYAVVAVPFDSLARMLPDVEESRILRENICHFETSPITGVHFWLDREITDLEHAVLLDRTIQWMFHKSKLLATPVRGADSREHEQAIGGNAQSSLNHLELVISSSKSLIAKSRQETIDLAWKELCEFFPRAREANLQKAVVIKELNATFSPQAGLDRYRPAAKTPWPRVSLAGDWTATGWPATMEGAARSGYLAAREIQKSAGVPQSQLVADLPAEGLMSILS